MWKVYIKACPKFFKYILPATFSLLLILVSIFSFLPTKTIPTSANSYEWNNVNEENSETSEDKKYIKWFEFNVTRQVLENTYKLDINSHNNNESVKLNWVELISYLACKYGNNFSKFKQADLDALVEKLRIGQSMDELTQNMKLYSYYFESYDAVLHELVGEYQREIENENTVAKQFETKYGLKAFHPLAKGYSYSHYDDFGNSRSYGYKRLHFGNDLMGSIGSPVIAVESGIIEAVRLEPIWWLENWYS